MTYELATQLRDLGFPQDINTASIRAVFVNDLEPVFYPSLSELIEACRDGFCELRVAVDGGWCCNTVGVLDSDKFPYSYGSTPEEAVANLWITIHSPLASQHPSD